MTRLQLFTFYVLITPAITWGPAAVLAQPTSDDEVEEAQRDRDATLVTGQGLDHDQQSNQRDRDTRTDSRTTHPGYMDSVPPYGMRISELMDAGVTTTVGATVGTVGDLIIDESGQVVAIIVGVGRFLGMSQKDVAIGWDEVTRSGDSGELELRIDATRENLRSAPEFEKE